MIVYHVVDRKGVPSILAEGLLRKSRGDKGDDKSIIKTDAFLDQHRPDELKLAGVCRDDNLYAYLGTETTIRTITNGETEDLAEFIKHTPQAVLRLTVDPERCFVSDLDRYDIVRQAVKHHQAQHQLEELAGDYWRAVRPLTSEVDEAIKRPELMITYNILPSHIAVLEA